MIFILKTAATVMPLLWRLITEASSKGAGLLNQPPCRVPWLSTAGDALGAGSSARRGRELPSVTVWRMLGCGGKWATVRGIEALVCHGSDREALRLRRAGAAAGQPQRCAEGLAGCALVLCHSDSLQSSSHSKYYSSNSCLVKTCKYVSRVLC